MTSVLPTRDFGFDFNVTGGSVQLMGILEQMDTAIGELENDGQLSVNNVQTLTRFTRRLHDDSLTHVERSRMAINLQKAVESVLTYSDVGDQILTKSRALIERFPQEFHNISFDFCDFRAFKHLALRDAETSLEHLSAHGYRREVAPVLKLVKTRIREFMLHSGAAQLIDCTSALMVEENQKKNAPTKEHYQELQKQMDELREHCQKLSAKIQRKKDKIMKEREMNQNLLDSLERVREQAEMDRMKSQFEIERRDKELSNLRAVAHDRIILQRQVESLRAQLAVQTERAENLQMKYDARRNLERNHP